MKCPCRGCTTRTLTCKYAGQCKPWEDWKKEEQEKKEWLDSFKPIRSEQMEKQVHKNVRRKARGWHRSRGGDDE